jgi:hypothetical protein
MLLLGHSRGFLRLFLGFKIELYCMSVEVEKLSLVQYITMDYDTGDLYAAICSWCVRFRIPCQYSLSATLNVFHRS